MMMTEEVYVTDPFPGWPGSAVRCVGAGTGRGERPAGILQEGELAHPKPS